MKKKAKEQPKPKQKEFAASPFKALKGVMLQSGEGEKAPTKSAPPQKKQPMGQESDDDIFAAAFADVRPMQAGKAPAAKKKQPSPQELEDDRLFLDAFADVLPLHPLKAAPHRAKAQAAQAEKDEEEMRVFLKAVETLKMDVRFSEELSEKPAAPRPLNRLRQVRRGGIRIDFELDLHGLTRDEAIEALERFVRGAYNRGQKGVLVITGKGNNSPGEPVLRNAVGVWLREVGKTMVSEFVAAPNDMGGSGAFVVFLREKKPEVEPESENPA